jgi:Ring hydroxylating alpha subunit (catalytic domain)
LAKVVAKSTRSTIERQASLSTPQLHGTGASEAPDNSLLSTQITDEDRRVAEAPDNSLLSTQITDEDRRVAEAIQRAMQLPCFSVGPMARDVEGAISEFQRNIAAFVSDSL